MRHADEKYDINVYYSSVDGFYELFTHKNIILEIIIIIHKLYIITWEKKISGQSLTNLKFGLVP